MPNSSYSFAVTKSYFIVTKKQPDKCTLSSALHSLALRMITGFLKLLCLRELGQQFPSSRVTNIPSKLHSYVAMQCCIDATHPQPMLVLVMARTLPVGGTALPKVGKT